MIAADANDPHGIVWIASYPRSGNTWVRVFLHHLVRIRSGRPAGDRELDRIGETSPGIAGRVDLFEKFIGKPIVSADMREIVLARPKVQEAMVREASGVLAVKTRSVLGRFFDVPLIDLGVSVGAVYLVRNPLDVALSLAAYLNRPVDAAIRSMAAQFNASSTTPFGAAEIWGSWTENVASWTTNAPPVVKVVRYEDLIAEPVATFTAIAEHMRFGATGAEIDEAVRLSSFERLANEEAAGNSIERMPAEERFFRVGRAGQWRDRLSAAQVEQIVADHGEQMRRFGYLPEQVPVS